MKALGNAACRRSRGRPVARLPVNALAAPLLPIGLLSRPALRLLLGLARLLLALALLLQLFVGLQVLLGRLAQRLGGLVHSLVNDAGELREGPVHRSAHLLEIRGRHARNGAARRPDRPGVGARRVRRRLRALGAPLRIPVGAVPPGAPLLLLEIFGHLVDVLGAGFLRPGLLRLALGSPPAVVRPSTARSRTLRIHGTTPNAPAQPADRIKAAEPRISCFPAILPRRFQPPAQPHGMRTTFKFPKPKINRSGTAQERQSPPREACPIPWRPSRSTNKSFSARDLEL